jgi:hypothetical protein
MKTYTIKIKIFHTGTLEIEADSKEKAELIARNNFAVWSNLSFEKQSDDRIKDWNINLSPEIEVKQ